MHGTSSKVSAKKALHDHICRGLVPEAATSAKGSFRSANFQGVLPGDVPCLLGGLLHLPMLGH